MWPLFMVIHGLKRERTNQKKIFIKEKFKEGFIYDELIKSYNVGILTAMIKMTSVKKNI